MEDYYVYTIYQYKYDNYWEVAVVTSEAYLTDLIEVGNNIRKARESLNLTQYELAEIAGFGEKTISKLELGKNMRIMTFFALAEVLGITPNELSPSRLLKGCTNADQQLPVDKLALLSDVQKKLVFKIIVAAIDGILDT